MVEEDELFSVVPHRGRMLLLSKITNYNPEERIIEAEYRIPKDCIFYNSALDGVPSWVGFEFIAQAISALSGIKNRENGGTPKIGFILGISQMQIDIPFFKTESTIAIKAKEIDHVDSLYIFWGEIFIEGRSALKGKLTVYDADDEQIQAVLRGDNING